MIYLVCGSDTFAKGQKISELKNKIFSSSSQSSLDVEILSGFKLNALVLKKSLMSMPILGQHRLVLIRDADRLTAEHRVMIRDQADKAKDFLVLVFDVQEAKAGESLIKQFGKSLDSLYFEQASKRNIFSLTRLIVGNKKTEALKQFAEFFEEGTHPLQMIPAIVWEWKRNKKRLGSAKFQEGLRMIQQADMNIKRSRLSAQQALEVLIVKLCSLAA
jgi:DNA polymerase III delta subunit